MERRIQRRMVRRARKVRKNIFFLLAVLLTISLGTLVLGEERENQRETFYLSVQLQKGDTLWQIAQEYKTEEMDTADMIEEIMQINCLKNTNIQAGENIIVPIVAKTGK